MFEQRKGERYETELHKLEYSFGPFSGEDIFEADIINYSESGLCILSSNQIAPGQEITIRNFMNCPSVTALAIWLEKTDEDLYKIGLMFV